jgi:hypothetical protein
MSQKRSPLPEDLDALMQIVGGKAADSQTMKRLTECDLVEELDGVSLLTSLGVEAASLLSTNVSV